MARVIHGGKTYELPEPQDWLLPETSQVKKLTGLPPLDVAMAAKSLDTECIAAWLMIAKKRAGETPKWSDFADFKVSDCEFPDGDEPDDATAEDDAKDDEPDPT